MSEFQLGLGEGSDFMIPIEENQYLRKETLKSVQSIVTLFDTVGGESCSSMIGKNEKE